MKNENKIKNLIKDDYLSIKTKFKNRKLDAKISRKIRFKNSKKVIVITIISLLGAIVFSYSLAMLLNY
jgi:hypothetical protein